MLPYSQLFGPNVVGTAELVRLALTHKMKRFVNVSAVAVAFGESGQVLHEDADVRAAVPSRSLQSRAYASGYAMQRARTMTGSPWISRQLRSSRSAKAGKQASTRSMS